MNHTITVRLGKDLAAWLEETAPARESPRVRCARALAKGKAARRNARLWRLAARFAAPTLSRRKGFSAS